MGLVSIYLRDGRVILHPDYQTEAGFWVASEPFYVLPENDKLQIIRRLGELYSANPTSEPVERKGLEQLYKLVGAKSWKDFARRSKLVLFEFSESWRLVTQTFDTESGGFVEGGSIDVESNNWDLLITMIEKALHGEQS